MPCILLPCICGSSNRPCSLTGFQRRCSSRHLGDVHYKIMSVFIAVLPEGQRSQPMLVFSPTYKDFSGFSKFFSRSEIPVFFAILCLTHYSWVVVKLLVFFVFFFTITQFFQSLCCLHQIQSTFFLKSNFSVSTCDVAFVPFLKLFINDFTGLTDELKDQFFELLYSVTQ